MTEDFFKDIENIFKGAGIFKEVEKFGENILKDLSSYKNTPFFRQPSCDIQEKDNEVTVRYELPGIAKEDIDLKVFPEYIQISAETKQKEKNEKGIFEKYTKFHRRDFFLYKIIPKQAKAKYKDGVLEVILKKAENSEENSKINIE